MSSFGKHPKNTAFPLSPSFSALSVREQENLLRPRRSSVMGEREIIMNTNTERGRERIERSPVLLNVFFVCV